MRGRVLARPEVASVSGSGLVSAPPVPLPGGDYAQWRRGALAAKFAAPDGELGVWSYTESLRFADEVVVDRHTRHGRQIPVELTQRRAECVEAGGSGEYGGGQVVRGVESRGGLGAHE